MYQQTAICSTLNSIPATASSLQKSRLPFGVHYCPLAREDGIPLIQDGPIVRCQYCRAFINPYSRISEHRTWQCNVCSKPNQTPPAFLYDAVTQQYYDLDSKPELTNESVEYIANSDYMVRPPQPAYYMFVFDCSRAAVDLGYIPIMAAALADMLDEMPGDARASVGFIGYDSNIHYFTFNGPQMAHLVCCDLDTPVIPCPLDGIFVNMTSKREMILDFLNQILSNFPLESSNQPGLAAPLEVRSCLGPAVKAAVKALLNIGGKITIIQANIPNHGNLSDGSVLTRRDNPKQMDISSDKNGACLTPLINPASDFYKELALECSEHNIAVDLFNLSTTFVDLSSISPLVKLTAGSLFHYSNSPMERKSTLVRFNEDFRNCLVRTNGLESVLRLRMTRGLKLHTFHGNFFVRSKDLMVLPAVNPDSSFTFQIAIEDDLKPEAQYVYIQTSLLYTTPDGERRIRVTTARFPAATNLPEIIYGANQIAVVGMLAKMAVDRSMQKSIGEAKEALIGAGVDILETFNLVDEMRSRSYAMSLPENLRLVPLYILALLKHPAFKISTSVKLDDRVAAMERLKTLPLDDLITYIYPDLFSLHNIANDPNEDWKTPIQLTAAHLERNGAYLLDAYDSMIIYVCENVDPRWCYDVFAVSDYTRIQEQQDVLGQDFSRNNFGPSNQTNFLGPSSSSGTDHHHEPICQQLPSATEIAEIPLLRLPELNTPTSIKLREFIGCLIDSKPQKPKFFILKENSPVKSLFTQYLINDRSESYHSYAEFCKFLQDQARK